ncbi:hypothetical protein ACPEER_02745 [Pasteurella sp. PK-2025]|uniref:hypothetical protein n=1 Tax=Pasteurella sp. PK-2025 TaxID=3413133 RepID=UPI003C777305
MLNNHNLDEQNEIRKLVKITFIIWVLCAIYLVFSQWNGVMNLHFNDNDDFMRFHQYREWLKNGNWYLQPIPQFSPNNQLIMHWSRLVDIPLVLFAGFFSFFFESSLAFALTNTIVPLLYLWIFLLVVALVSYRLFGMETAKIAMLMPLISPLSMRFLPGALDHHNLQFILLALFLFFSPLVSVRQRFHHAFFSALCMVLSLWIGLENIYTFVVILFLLTLWGYFSHASYLTFCQSVSLYAVLFIPICLVLNRPVSEFFVAHYDALSFPFWLCFLSALVFCYALRRISPVCLSAKIAVYLGLGVLVLLPVVVAYPELLQGGYANYPELLKRLWLDNVSEARSIFTNMQNDLGHIGYFFAVLMAILSPYFFDRKETRYHILYVAFLINFLLASFWQIRMIAVALVCGIPLQAYVCAKLREKFHHVLVKILVLFLSFPSFVLFLFILLFSSTNEQMEEKEGSHFSVIEFLNKHHIQGKNTLASIDLGAPIIVGTDNTIISAPYHRNIQGNLDLFRFFLAEDEGEAKAILDKYRIDYVLLDKNFYQHISRAELENTLLERIFKNKKVPAYLEYVDSDGFIKLYRYVGGKNE